MAGRAVFDEGDKMRRFRKNLQNPRKALKQIGVLMVSESHNAFKQQKLGRETWEPRAPVNVYGIISDFHEGKKEPPARRFERRPALIDTARMRNTIDSDVKGKKMVEVGSNLPYAPVLHHGGKIESKPINGQVQHLLWQWLRKQGQTMKRKLGWLLNRKFRNEKLEGEVPARPIVGITKQTIEDVQEAVGVYIMEVK